MQDVYYHATPAENLDSIMNKGLRPTNANECECGQGVHVTEEQHEADLWCARLDHEIMMSNSDVTPRFVILEVVVDEDDYDIRRDLYKGESLSDLNNLVICTDTPISPSNLTVVKDEREHSR